MNPNLIFSIPLSMVIKLYLKDLQYTQIIRQEVKFQELRTQSFIITEAKKKEPFMY